MGVKLQMLGVAFGLSTLLTKYAPHFSVGLIGTGILLFLLQLLAWNAWAILVYPRFFSPIRHVPEAPDGEFFTGHTRKIFKASSGQPMREWIESVPNDGLIRYSNFGAQRLLPTSAKALGEVLVTRNYDFVKPPQIQASLSRLLGVGILLAEGDEHKRQRKLLMPAFAFR